jgi:hypothetical protein
VGDFFFAKKFTKARASWILSGNIRITIQTKSVAVAALKLALVCLLVYAGVSGCILSGTRDNVFFIIKFKMN